MQHAQPDATQQSNKGVARRNIVSGGEAAKALGIHRSTLGRYLQSYPELNRSSREDKILVDLEELRRHREENVNRLKSGNHAGRLYDEQAPLLPAENGAAVERSDDDEDEADGGSDLQDETVAKIRAKKERILLNRLEREEAAASGQLTPTVEVEQASGEALVKVRNALMSPDLDLCEKLAATNDAAEVTAILREANRAVLVKLSEAFEQDVERGGAA